MRIGEGEIRSRMIVGSGPNFRITFYKEKQRHVIFRLIIIIIGYFKKTIVYINDLLFTIRSSRIGSVFIVVVCCKQKVYKINYTPVTLENETFVLLKTSVQ